MTNQPSPDPDLRGTRRSGPRGASPHGASPHTDAHDTGPPPSSASTDAAPAEIGSRIRAARLARGWTQDRLATAIGVSRSAVAQWETGRAGQITGNLARIAATLDTHVEQLMFGADKHAPERADTGDELAMLRLYRACSPEDRQILLRTARRLARV